MNGAWRFSIPALSDRFLLMCPVREGWAVIGRTDKYLSPAAVEVTSRTRNALALRMVESGPLAVWSDGRLGGLEGRAVPGRRGWALGGGHPAGEK